MNDAPCTESLRVRLLQQCGVVEHVCGHDGSVGFVWDAQGMRGWHRIRGTSLAVPVCNTVHIARIGHVDLQKACPVVPLPCMHPSVDVIVVAAVVVMMMVVVVGLMVVKNILLVLKSVLATRRDRCVSPRKHCHRYFHLPLPSVPLWSQPCHNF